METKTYRKSIELLGLIFAAIATIHALSGDLERAAFEMGVSCVAPLATLTIFRAEISAESAKEDK